MHFLGFRTEILNLLLSDKCSLIFCSSKKNGILKERYMLLINMVLPSIFLSHSCCGGKRGENNSQRKSSALMLYFLKRSSIKIRSLFDIPLADVKKSVGTKRSLNNLKRFNDKRFQCHLSGLKAEFSKLVSFKYK